MRRAIRDHEPRADRERRRHQARGSIERDGRERGRHGDRIGASDARRRGDACRADGVDDRRSIRGRAEARDRSHRQRQAERRHDDHDRRGEAREASHQESVAARRAARYDGDGYDRNDRRRQ